MNNTFTMPTGGQTVAGDVNIHVQVASIEVINSVNSGFETRSETQIFVLSNVKRGHKR